MVPVRNKYINWIRTQYIVDHITQLVYLVKMDNNDMINVDLKKITRKDDVSYSTKLSGDTYQPNNAIF